HDRVRVPPGTFSSPVHGRTGTGRPRFACPRAQGPCADAHLRPRGSRAVARAVPVRGRTFGPDGGGSRDGVARLSARRTAAPNLHHNLKEKPHTNRPGPTPGLSFAGNRVV